MGAVTGRVGLSLGPLFLCLLHEVFADDVWVGQVEVRRLEDEVGAPDGEQPANPGEDQPWEDVRVFLVHERWSGVGKGCLESPEVTVRGRDQVGLVRGNDDGRGNRGSKNDDDGEYRASGFDSVPHHGFGESWPEEEEEEHGALVENHGSAPKVDIDRGEKVTYENGSGVDASEDGERANADDIVVEQRGTGLIVFDGLLKAEIPGTTQGSVLRVIDASRSVPTMMSCTRGEEIRTGREYR